MDPTAKSSRIPAWDRCSLTRLFSVGYIIALRYFRMLTGLQDHCPSGDRKHNWQKAGHTAATGKFA